MNDIEALKEVAWKKTDSTAARLFMRPVSIRITSLLLRTGLQPGHITLFSFGLRLLASLLFVFNEYPLAVLAGVSLYFAHVFDCVDGEVARARGIMSFSGGLLDYFLDRVGDIAVYLSISVSLFIAANSERILVLGIFVIASNLFMTDVSQKTEFMKRKANIEPSGLGVKSYFYYGGSANTMILLASSILNTLFEGMILIGFLSSSFAVIRFVEAYVALKEEETSSAKHRHDQEKIIHD